MGYWLDGEKNMKIYQEKIADRKFCFPYINLYMWKAKIAHINVIQ